ncbi:MAG TPA: DUF2723 domain-containing protein, partial [Abditibacteriaceae bacterium]
MNGSDDPRRQRLFCAGATGLLSFVVYFFCLSSTVTYGGDSGELIAASYRLGIAHPTGYALYCLLGRLFAALFPFGEVAFRYNLFSALCGASAVALVTASVHRLTFAQFDSGPGPKSTAEKSGFAIGSLPALGAGL